MGQRFNRLGVSKKQKKPKKSSSIKVDEDQSLSQQTSTAATSEKPIIKIQDNPTFDFFGFSPTNFYRDFKKTIFSSLAILLILLIIFFVIK